MQAIDKIGLVDDDPVFAAIAEMLLFSLGQKNVVSVDNTPDSIARFALAANQKTLLITSLKMQAMDGLSVMRELSKSGYQGFVAISGRRKQRCSAQHRNAQISTHG